MAEHNRGFTGATSAEINTVIELLEKGSKFLETLQLATVRVRDALLETERFRAAVKRGDTVLDWKMAVQEMEGFNEIASMACANALLERFDMGKCTILAVDNENHGMLTMMKGQIEIFLTERYGVKFKVRINKPEQPY